MKKFVVEEIWFKVRRNFLVLISKTNNFAFEVKVVLGLESNGPDG